MSSNFGSPNPIQPLSLGNVVSAAVRLYRSHFKSYFQLALIATLWSLVPIYGWAKSLANSALISRLAFGELVNQPESVTNGRLLVNTKLWKFLELIFLILGIWIGIFIALVIVLFIVVFTVAIGISVLTGANTTTGIAAVSILIPILFIIIFLFIFFWFQARFLIVEVPLTIEEDRDGLSTIRRSWDLTKGHIRRIALILFVGYLITLPFQILVSLMSNLIQFALVGTVSGGDANTQPIFWLSFIISLTLGLAASALILPFWQSIKAVIYYDLRSRREGLGLTLRDRNI